MPGRISVISRYWLLLQVMSALACVGTTWRLLHDYRIPNIFMCLPLALVLIPFIIRYTGFADDPFTRMAITGVATGVTCGFLSTVTNVLRTSVLYMQTTELNRLGGLQVLELLHLPVICIALIDSFLRVLKRLPTMRSLHLAAMTALVADFLIISCVLLVVEKSYAVLDLTNLFLGIYIHVLMLSCLPLFRDASRGWLLLLVVYSISLQWQVGSLGFATWHLEKLSFPIPGALLGVIYVFHCRTDTTPSSDAHENVGSLYWHAIAFICERIALGGIYRAPHATSDVVSACLTLAIHCFIISPFYDASKALKVTASAACLFSFVCHTLVNGSLWNGYVVDIGLAMCLVEMVNANCSTSARCENNNSSISNHNSMSAGCRDERVIDSNFPQSAGSCLREKVRGSETSRESSSYQD